MNSAPLAEHLRPHCLDDIIGRQHLLGEGKPLCVAFASAEPPAMILWERLGVKDSGEVLERTHLVGASSGHCTILFADVLLCINKAVKHAKNQWLEEIMVQTRRLSHGLARGNHV